VIDQYRKRVQELMLDIAHASSDLIAICEETGEDDDELWIERDDIKIVIYRIKEGVSLI
jgi:hypothetical protein